MRIEGIEDEAHTAFAKHADDLIVGQPTDFPRSSGGRQKEKRPCRRCGRGVLSRLPLAAGTLKVDFRGPRDGGRNCGLRGLAGVCVAGGVKQRRGMAQSGLRLDFLPNLTASDTSAEVVAKTPRFGFGEARVEQSAQVAKRRTARIGRCRFHRGYPCRGTSYKYTMEVLPSGKQLLIIAGVCTRGGQRFRAARKRWRLSAACSTMIAPVAGPEQEARRQEPRKAERASRGPRAEGRGVASPEDATDAPAEAAVSRWRAPAVERAAVWAVLQLHGDDVFLPES